MTIQAALTIFDILGIILMLGIVISYSFAAIWNILFVKKTKWQMYSWIKIYSASICFLVVMAYLYLLICSIVGTEVGVGNFGIIIIRPLILLMGGAFASSARARLTSLQHGGEKWILRNFKD